MLRTKPKVQIVSDGQYVWAQGKMVGLFSLTGLAAVAGIIGLLISMIGGFFLVVDPPDPNKVPYESAAQDWLDIVSMFVFSGVLLAFSVFSFKRGKDLAQTIYVTNQEVPLLPLQETLVRSSNIPPSMQQAELLRGVQTEQETPKEQLLRPVTEEE